MTDPLIARLSDERDALVERVSAIDSAIEALTGTRPSDTSDWAVVTRRTGSVGSDKKADVLALIKERGEIRQAEIHRILGVNSGSVSNACRELEAEGLIEEITGRKSGKVWRATKKSR